MKLIASLLLFWCLSFTLPSGNVVSRFKVPAGWRQAAVPQSSFGGWLQQLPLKPAGTPTRTYSGGIAATNRYTAAVVDMSVGTQDLQQCADAVIRLRGEYLYRKKDYTAIRFHFSSGFLCDFVHYANGYRYQLGGAWKLTALKDYSYDSFMRYMNLVFSYAGTLSLDKELTPVAQPADLKAGDVFIRGGSPGHCLIVLDVLTNRAGEKQFLLAQSFMPAQNIQVLQQNGSPWFSLAKPAQIPYGELVSMAYLKRFE